MAIQTSDGITSPGVGDAFNYAAQLATLAQTAQLALEKRANSYIGTSAEREAVRLLLTEGSLWSDTNGDKALYMLQGSQWERIWPEVKGPRVTTGWFTMQSGWKARTTTTNHINRRGDWVYLYLGFERSGGTINVPSSGNIPNFTIGQVKPEWVPNTVQPLGGGNATGRLAGYTINSVGQIRLNSVAGTSNINKGHGFQVRGWYRTDI